uniref:PhoH-like protein domain-containing protein n=1 Tax=Aureoumbra lagunensis TaxID=44058 RepID=A0A7S3NM36_9STRA|mmetsp:Transcript_15523/g.23368  ORF Transcript_15523/g.23368 Transcript_15523/m.23368 type:complete len:210 (-) Transcript_15523:107-736(-)
MRYFFLFLLGIVNGLFISPISPKNVNQMKYWDALQSDITKTVIAEGPTKTGKSLIVVSYALEKFLNNKFNTIIVTCPYETFYLDREMFYSCGLSPQELQEYKDIQCMRIDKLRKLTPKTLIIAEHMEHSTKHQMYKLLMSLERNCKIVITGNLNDTEEKQNGLSYLINRVKEEKPNCFDVIQMNHADYVGNGEEEELFKISVVKLFERS